MSVPGFLYIALGFFLRIFNQIHGNKNRTTDRISWHFLMIGFLNVCILILRAILPEYDLPLLLVAIGSIVLFGILVLMEFNKGYREYRNKVDAILNGEDIEKK